MNTNTHENSDTGQEPPEQKKLRQIIRDWAGKNKKAFWKYEVTCFYKTYIIRITNLPEPSAENILLSPNNRILNEKQKKQLSEAITKICTTTKMFNNSSLDVKIDYDKGRVTAEILQIR